jgi:hypothetical protein
MSSINCAAVSGLMAMTTRNPMIRLSQANSGILPSVIPVHRMTRMVVTILMAVPSLPTPESNSPSVQKSELWPGENISDVKGA